MSKYTDIYPWSRKEAQRNGEDGDWIISFSENCACARAIEQAIKTNYSKNSLNGECAKGVIEQYGFDRVNWVLANTIQNGEHDGRYSKENKEWAEKFFVPKEERNLQYRFAVGSHPGLVDIFTNLARKEWQALGLYDKSHCYAENMDFTGKVIVLRPSVMNDEDKSPENQLFYASGGNGCRPQALGTKVFGQFLVDGEKAHFLRGDFIGVLKLDLLPDWAQTEYAKITGTQDDTEDIEQDGADIKMGGIT